jgi:hypothetical protein
MPTSRSIGARSLVLRQGKVALIGRVPVLGLIRSVFECGGIEFSGSLLNPPPSVAVEYDSSTYINNFPVPVHWTSPCVALIFRSFRRSQRRPMARAREAGVPQENFGAGRQGSREKISRVGPNIVLPSEL